MVAEIVTGILLLSSGAYMLLNHQIGPLFHISSGALIYTLIASPGYYAQNGEWAVFIIFIMMLLLTVFFVYANREK